MQINHIKYTYKKSTWLELTIDIEEYNCCNIKN